MKKISAILFYGFAFLGLPSILTAQTSTTPKDSLVLPMLPDTVVQYLWDKCNSVDYIFYNFPASINLDNPTSIRQGIRHIGAGKVSNRQQCKSIGKIFFYAQGNLYFDTDVYFDGGACAYFVYTRNGQALYANRMSTEGVGFFNEILQKVKVKSEKH